MKYRSSLSVFDLWEGVLQDVGSSRHCALLDQIAACLDESDSETLRVMTWTGDYDDAARALFEPVERVETRYRRLKRRAR